MAKQKNLVIVESPAKAKTIGKFLGADYKVLSSYGHIRDLKPSSFSVDVEHRFAPIYEIPADKQRLVSDLRKAAKASDVVWLASDEDREGEAIAWHLYHVLDLQNKETHRIAFHEITKSAIQHAIQNPRSINENLVDAQQARRVLDRIVGFELSPVLWRRVGPSLSAGRVQSVAVRLIVEREREILAFQPETSFAITTRLETKGGDTFSAALPENLPSEEAARQLMQRAIDSQSTFAVQQVEQKPGRRSPSAPFTTSTLQQEASRKLGMSVSNTMRVAQALYERGLITYMRTDSVNLSSLALHDAETVILEQWGADYYQRRRYHVKSKGAQEAHEAIRPTYLRNATIQGTKQEQALYDLIRKRTLASQMADARIERTIAQIASQGADPVRLEARGEVIIFDGFISAYTESRDDEEDTSSNELPKLKEGDLLQLREIEGRQSFTKPKPRYTEASLVRKMEELGIGRPSTYAPTIQTIQNREYVRRGESQGESRDVLYLSWQHGAGNTTIKSHKQKERYGGDRGRLVPTDMGMVVTDFLMENFSRVVDYNFTADVEERFDKVAEGEAQWQDLIGTFYDKFHPMIEEQSQSGAKRYTGERLLGTDPVSGKPVIARIGRYGPMVQIGEAPDNSLPEAERERLKPRFASIPSNLLIETITLEEALKLFDLPRTVGEFEGGEVVAAVGRFGPYLRHKGAFTSIPKSSGLTPEEITLQEAIELIEEKRRKDAASLLKTFPEDPDIAIRDGRWGAYIKVGKKNYKLTKEQKADPTKLTYAEVVAIIAEQDKETPKKGRTTAKKTASTAKKKSATKKTTTTTKKTTSTAKKAASKRSAASKS
ncbi:type I DNA topoisomerase [uncultured Porphyromonas sp.]|uniref:type I DNA topoisomerase n=1 Tax=uncultured Porphyromonas sp. TaxID=159274 RepID=UPI00266DB880|nr:type I DNA topoisomerase [uncultured Porphyromonas sp.]